MKFNACTFTVSTHWWIAFKYFYIEFPDRRKLSKQAISNPISHAFNEITGHFHLLRNKLIDRCIIQGISYIIGNNSFIQWVTDS